MLTKPPGCIKKLKIKWEFLQLFSVFRRIPLHPHFVSYTLKSAFGRFIHNSMQKNNSKYREWLQKFTLNLKLLYATEPRFAEKASLIKEL